MSKEWDTEVRAFLNAATRAEAFSIVRSGETSPTLELWRLLADGGDPISESCQMNDLENLLQWPPCQSMGRLRAYGQEWEDAVRLYETRSGETFPKDYWRVGLLRLCPPKLYEELKHIKANFPTYASLKSHIRTLVVDREHKGKPGLNSLEEQREANQALQFPGAKAFGGFTIKSFLFASFATERSYDKRGKTIKLKINSEQVSNKI